MINIEKRQFLKNIGISSLLISLSVTINEVITRDTNMKFINKKFFAMGTNGKIQAFTNDTKHGVSVAEEAIKRIKELEKLISKFAIDSDIAKLNENYQKYNSVSEETLKILETSNKYYKMTDGYFDIGLGNILTLSGIDKNVPINGTYLKKDDLKSDIIKIKNDTKVKINRLNSSIDLGGIGKGYALDQAIDIFKKNKINHVAIEFGGDIKTYGGMPNNLPWIINLDTKLLKKKLDYENIKLYSGSIALSGGYIKKSPNNSTFKHHIINPKKLESSNQYTFTLIEGDNSEICDMLATATFNMNEFEINKIKNTFLDYNINTYK